MRITWHAILRFVLQVLLPGFVLGLATYVIAELWSDAKPPRDVQVTTAVVTWDDDRRVLDLKYQPVSSRRCPSESTHYLERTVDGKLQRIGIWSHNGGIAPVGQDGKVIQEPFDAFIPLPVGLPPGMWYHTSVRATHCALLWGFFVRNPPPEWTTPVEVVIP